MSNCVCGHDRLYHDSREGCVRFLCCDRKRNLFVGKRHTEHDGINHQSKPCLCGAFEAQPDRWDEDTEAGAIG